MPVLGSADVLIRTIANTAGVSQAISEIEGMSNKMTAIGHNIAKVGAGLTLGLTLPIVGAFGVSAEAAIQFQQSMLHLQTQAGYTHDDIVKLSPQVLNLAGTLGQKPTELAHSLYEIASAGVPAAKAIDMMKLAAEGAAVGGADLTDTTSSLVSTMATGIDGAQDMTTTMGTLNAIVGAGKMHFQDLNEAISSGFLSTAQTFGVSLQSVGAALAFMTDRGEPAAQSATRLRMSIALMGAPTERAAKILGDLGMSSTDAMSKIAGFDDILKRAGVTTTTLAADLRKPDGIQVAVKDLTDHLKKSGLTAEGTAAVISHAFGGGKSGGTIEALAQSTAGLAAKFELVKTKSGDFASSWSEQQKTAAQHMANLMGALDALKVEIGDKLLPYLTKFADSLGKLVKGFNDLSPAQQDVLVKVGIFAAVVGPLLIALGTFISSIRAIWGGLQTLGGALTLATANTGLLTTAVSALPAAVTIGVALIGAAVILASIYEIKTNLDGLKGEMNDLASSQQRMQDQDNQLQSAINKARAKGDKTKVANLEKAYQLQAPAAPDLNWFQQLAANGLSMPHFASGVRNFSGGAALVGENGPEMVTLPGGSNVYPNGTGPGGGGMNLTVNINGGTLVEGSDWKKKLADEIGRQLGPRFRQASNGVY